MPCSRGHVSTAPPATPVTHPQLPPVAAGLSGAGRPLYRFHYLMPRALEFAGEVRSLGGALLSALEKGDAEELAELRAAHQSSLASQVLDVKREQVREANASLDSLRQRRAQVEHRQAFYAELYANGKIQQEKDEREQLKKAQTFSTMSQNTEGLASSLFLVSDVAVGIAAKVEFGGTHLGNATRAGAALLGSISSEFSYQAGRSAREASDVRRAQEWKFQADSAAKEMAQIDKDILAAEIRLAVAGHDVTTQELQLAQAEQEETFLTQKFTGRQLQQWMASQLSTLYFQSYQLALDMAQKAELAYRHELGVSDTLFVGVAHWDSLRKGLLAGERLALDLRRMEQAYAAANVRQLELTKHVSLALTDPAALLQLRTTGECTLVAPEMLFDLDYPGHYMRRIKTVRVTIPALSGPYTNLSCTLTLTRSYWRRSAGGGLEEFPGAPGQRLATSSAHQDGGLFQMEFRDERYLPFEGDGAVSEWMLRLSPPSLAQFDYGAISDVILHLNYTARSGEDQMVGSQTFRDQVTGDLLAALREQAGPDSGLPLLLSVKQQWPDEWRRLSASSPTLQLQAGPERFPFFSRNRIGNIASVDVYVAPKPGTELPTGTVGLLSMTLGDTPPTNPAANHNLAVDAATELPKASFTYAGFSPGAWQLTLPAPVASADSLDDVFLLCRYSLLP